MSPDLGTFGFDLDSALSAVVAVRSHVPEDGLTAATLGTERSGNGVLIGDGDLIVTIGYLVTEAETIWVVDGSGGSAPGNLVGYDQETGLALLQPLQPIAARPLRVGRSGTLVLGQRLVVAGHGGQGQAIAARLTARREFAGYWEYVLDEALFTTPAHPSWGGAAVIDEGGELVGIGSLLVQQSFAGNLVTGANMVVPIDLLPPIVEDLRRFGRPARAPRPWLGWLVQEASEHLVVAGLYEGCPAARAGLRVGDIVTEVDGAPVASLAALFRRIWSLGPAGVRVPLGVVRDGVAMTVTAESVDRHACLKRGPLH
jgi:S1-C subfamily serine protease